MPYPWSAGNVLTATDLNSSLAAKRDNAPAINAQTGTTYTFVLADATAGKTITASNASASTYTVPPQSSVAFSIGALLQVTNLGAGVVTFAAGVGVTVTNTAGTLAQYQSATLVRTGSDAWTVIPAGGGSGLAYITKADFSASSAVIVNSCFSASYDIYQISVVTSVSTPAQLTLKLRVSGSDTSTGYNYQNFQFDAGTPSYARSVGVTAAELAYLHTTRKNLVVITIAQPAIAEPTLIRSTGYSSLSEAFIKDAAANQTSSTQFDGFSLIPSTGNITGTVRVYGYKNS